MCALGYDHMGTTTLTKPETPIRIDRGGPSGGGFGGDGFGGAEFGEARPWRVPDRAYRTAMWMGLTSIVMLFAAFTSALVVRKGLSDDWVSFAIPRILWLNTAVLLASSGSLEIARRALAKRIGSSFTGWLYATTALGVLFLIGQWTAWRELAFHGVYLASNPSSSFFYLLTAAHGLHLSGGIIALLYLVFRSRAITSGLQRRTAVDVAAIYWHFMGGLWIYTFFLLMTRF